MKKNIKYIIALILFTQVCKAQETIYPTPEQKGTFYITHATIHVGNGQIINDGTIKITNGKIESVGNNISSTPDAARVIDARGKQVYPGLISSITNLGLKEVGSGVRGSNDYNEIGDINPSIRAIVAYNTDSKVINTLRSNGILLANVVPQEEEAVSSNLITGTSSVVQLDAWNWEDAAYKMDGQLHLNIPSLLNRPNFFALFFGITTPQVDPVKSALEKMDRVKSFFRQAKAYTFEPTHKETNLKFAAVKDLFTKKQKLFVHCNAVKEMLLAIDFVTEFGFDVVIVGGSESWQIADLLKQNNLPVILRQLHSLPENIDDDVDQPFKTPYILQRAGVLFALSDNDAQTRGRNLMFNAGTAVANGLTKEEALSAITLNAAKVLGISNITGSIEAGKDANIVVSEGDILDMKSSVITNAFIQGREINLTNKHTQLYEKYKYKYGLK
ncbi:MAG: amidohydrolase family protein [Bacteroidota bacterium]|nr:amidohydrolase family protein [Bacteroidota bacterium]